MSKIMGNLNLLKTDMVKRGWFIDSFEFKYKSIHYIVLAKRYLKDENKPKFALLKLEFLKRNDFNHSLEVPANSTSFDVNPKTFREYFNIEYNENLGNIFNQFYQYFAGFIPIEVKESKTKEEKVALVRSLSHSDGEDPSKVYCFAVRRNSLKENGKRGRRRPYNDNKARILKPELYAKLYTDEFLSFCFSADYEDKKSNEEIISNWHKNRNND